MISCHDRRLPPPNHAMKSLDSQDAMTRTCCANTGKANRGDVALGGLQAAIPMIRTWMVAQVQRFQVKACGGVQITGNRHVLDPSCHTTPSGRRQSLQCDVDYPPIASIASTHFFPRRNPTFCTAPSHPRSEALQRDSLRKLMSNPAQEAVRSAPRRLYHSIIFAPGLYPLKVCPNLLHRCVPTTLKL